MKILFITNSLVKGKDGVGDYTRKLGQQFKKNNHEVIFMASKAEAGEDVVGDTKIYIIDKWGWASINPIFKLIIEIKPDWLIIQYVPFAFHPRGFPFWLCFF